MARQDDAGGGLTVDVPALAGASDPLTQARGLVQHVRDLMRQVATARDAAVLVHRSSAVEHLIDQALKTCCLLAEDQFDIKQDAAEAHIRTQRRAGELLMSMAKHVGGRPSKSASGPPGSTPVTLREMGIDSTESYRWQRIAGIPDDLFEGFIAGARERRRELTTSATLKYAGQIAADGRDDLDLRPSGVEAMLAEYETARRHAWNLIWLDPMQLVTGMSGSRRAMELEGLRRMRMWLDEFEHALVSGPDREARLRRLHETA